MMTINRHNYEECFILYWDNELTSSQKQAIENFVKENPDLQEEFKILGETRFTADSKIQFEEKDFLLNSSAINITNYEEQLLNYIDDELGIEERAEVERTAKNFPLIQKELLLLQKTKLQPESIVFSGKSNLYRREERVRVIRMTWFRVAVAAAIILIAGFTALQLVNTNRDGNEVARIDESKTPATRSDDPSTTSAGQKSPEQTALDQSAPKVNAGNEKENGTKKKNEIKAAIENSNEKSSIAANQPENRNGLPKESTRSNEASTSEIIADVNILDGKDNSGALTNEMVATPVVLNVTSKDNPALYIPEPEEKEKGGLKEFLRKTTRVFERRTKIQTTTEDNKLLVGAFAVSLK